jgi:insertion element IS1 protein InsB
VQLCATDGRLMASNDIDAIIHTVSEGSSFCGIATPDDCRRSKASRGHGAQWQRDPRYGAGVKDQSHDGDDDTQKKASARRPVNPVLVTTSEGASPAVVIHKVQQAELDEMWSFVGRKQQPRWLWEALDHQTGRIVAYTFGRRAHRALVKLKALLAPFGIRRFYTDGWGAYRRHLDPRLHMVGKRRTQQLERKHLTLRTRIKRLVRTTICFSRSVQLHETVIGLFINRFEFGLQI